MKLFHRRLSRRAFTLIEMLVVITLIAILVAILFPVFRSVRERARATACMSNLQQIGRAVRLFADENQNRLPPVLNYTYTFNSTVTMSNGSSTFQGVDQLRTLVQSLQPYLKNYQVWFCKSDWLLDDANTMLTNMANQNLVPAGTTWGSEEAAKAGVISFAYAANTNNTYYGAPDPYCPSRDLLRADTVNIQPDPAAPKTDHQGNKVDRSATKVSLLVDNWIPVWEQVNPDRNKGPHNEGSNVLFMDGHVALTRFDAWDTLHPPLVPLQ